MKKQITFCLMCLFMGLFAIETLAKSINTAQDKETSGNLIFGANGGFQGNIQNVDAIQGADDI